MNSEQVFQAIEAIAAEPSKNEKVRLVKEALADSGFETVLIAALDPLITYGISEIDGPFEHVENPTQCFDEQTWLILKGLAARTLTGTAARETVDAEMLRLAPGSAELFKRIIKKDLRAGFGESTVNKAKPKTIRAFPYMRCSLPKDAKLDKFSWEEGVYSQLKADGTFANVDHEGDMVRVTSRQGTPYPLEEFASIVADVKARLTDKTQTHGELVVFQDGVMLSRPVSNGIMTSVAEGGKLEAGQVIHYFAWDSIPLSAVQSKGKYPVPYKERYGALKASIGTDESTVHLIETRVVHSLQEAYAHFGDVLRRGLEGTVFKDGNAEWKDGTSKFQIKLKLDVDVDLQVVAIVPGKADTKNEGRAGSLTCQTSDGLLRVDVTVKNEDMRDRVDAAPEDWLNRIITVKFNTIMEPSDSNPFHSLFLPRMVEANYRKDKTEADSLQRVRDQYDAALNAGAKHAELAKAA